MGSIQGSAGGIRLLAVLVCTCVLSALGVGVVGPLVGGAQRAAGLDREAAQRAFEEQRQVADALRAQLSALGERELARAAERLETLLSAQAEALRADQLERALALHERVAVEMSWLGRELRAQLAAPDATPTDPKRLEQQLQRLHTRGQRLLTHVAQRGLGVGTKPAVAARGLAQERLQAVVAEGTTATRANARRAVRDYVDALDALEQAVVDVALPDEQTADEQAAETEQTETTEETAP